MKKEIYQGSSHFPSTILSDGRTFGRHLTDSLGEEVEIVKSDDIRSPDAYQNYKGSYLVAHFVPQGVTLHYSGRNFSDNKTNFRITLFGKPEDISGVEQIILAEIEKITSQPNNKSTSSVKLILKNN